MTHYRSQHQPFCPNLLNADTRISNPSHFNITTFTMSFESSLSSSSRRTPWSADVDNIFCHCGLPVKQFTSWTETNPGRRFYRCPRPQGHVQCQYFAWIDSPIYGRGRDVIINLRKEKRELEQQLYYLRLELSNRNCGCVWRRRFLQCITMSLLVVLISVICCARNG